MGIADTGIGSMGAGGSGYRSTARLGGQETRMATIRPVDENDVAVVVDLSLARGSPCSTPEADRVPPGAVKSRAAE